MTRTEDLIQGLIEDKTETVALRKEAAEQATRAAGEFLAEADRAASDIVLLEAALSDLRAHQALKSARVRVDFAADGGDALEAAFMRAR